MIEAIFNRDLLHHGVDKKSAPTMSSYWQETSDYLYDNMKWPFNKFLDDSEDYSTLVPGFPEFDPNASYDLTMFSKEFQNF